MNNENQRNRRKRVLKRRVVFFLVLMGLPVYPLIAQKPRLNVMTHKYSKGDIYRISLQHYQSFMLSAPGLNRSTTGETAYDLYLKCLESDGDVFDMQAHAEITRAARNGINLTYQLRSSVKQSPWLFAFDKFGRILPESVKPVDARTTDSVWINNFLWFLILLPDHPVKPGQSWDVLQSETEQRIQSVIGEPIKLSRSYFKGFYRLDAIDDGVAKISLDAELSGAGKASATEKEVLEFDVLIHVLGQYELHIASGKLINGHLTAELAAIGMNAGKEVNFSGTHSLQFSMDRVKP